MRRCTVEWKGRQVEGEELTWTVDPGSESWSSYVLEDGSRAQIKHILVRVVRLNERADDGQPVYIFFPTDLNIVHTAPHMMVVDESARSTPPPPQAGASPPPPPPPDRRED